MSSGAEGDVDRDAITNISIQVVNVSLPTNRLARRIKLWSLSSGFAVNDESDVDQLIQELKGSNEPTLMSLPDADRSNFHNWVDVIALLNAREFQMTNLGHVNLQLKLGV